MFSLATVRCVAATAAFLAAIIVAVTRASSWKQGSADHAADKLLWSAVESDVEEIKLRSNGALDDHSVTELLKDRASALDKEHNLTPAELRRARAWLAGNPRGSVQVDLSVSSATAA